MQIIPSMSCTQSFKLCWINYAKFSGRARRSEFFYFYSIINAIILTFYIISYIIAKNNYNEETKEYENKEDYAVYLLISLVVFFVTFLPILGLEVRRLHDTGKSGWLVLIRLLPLIGEFLLLGLFCGDSEQMENKYGPSPKYIIPAEGLFPGNNYNPPVGEYSQFNSLINDNRQQIPLQRQAIPYRNPPYSQQNPLSQPNNIPQPQNIPNSQANHIQQPLEGSSLSIFE